MRVLLACVRYPPAPGGAEAHAQALAEGLAARGHDVEVHTTDLWKEVPATRRDAWPEDGASPVRVVRHRARRVEGRFRVTASPALWRALRERAREADVVHALTYGYSHTAGAALAARLARRPFVMTPHFHPPEPGPDGVARRSALGRAYDALVSRPALGAARAVLFDTSGEREEMARWAPVDPARAVVLPCGIDPAPFRDVPDGRAFRDAFGVGGPLVLYAGRLATNKRLDLLVRAFARVAKERPAATLALVGEDQDQRAPLERLAKELGVAERVVLTGALPAPLYRSALAAADVFVLPSDWEAFGIVLVEAMACGRPCVSTRNGGAPDIVVDGETGFLVDRGDEAALADRVARLLADPALARAMGERGRARALSRFTWDAHVDATLGVYRRIVGEA